MFSFSSRPAAAAGSSGDALGEKVKEWKAGLRKEMHGLDRQIREVQRVEEANKREAKQFANKDPVIFRMLAKNVVKARQTVEQLAVCKAQLNSVTMQLQEQYGMSKMAGVMRKSTEITKSMNALINAPAVMAQMREMAAEMSKAGIVDDIIQDALKNTEPPGLEEEADEEVQRVMAELTAGILGAAPAATHALPAAQAAAAQPQREPAAAAPRAAVTAGAAAGDDMGDLMSRLGQI